jgi:uncharacterized protein (TIGR02145 family)
MSIYNCHKQQPQPWMSYISDKNICYTGGCCPALVTNTTSLLPFQIISRSSFMKMEISPHGDNDWDLITIPYTEVYIDGFYFISYNGSALAETLDCGAYDFKLTAGETWYFEPITVKDFTIVENVYTIRDDLMLPFKFTEQQLETTPLIAPCDSFLPFMFSTENETSGTVTVYLYDANCLVTELTDIVVTVLTVSGKTYYIHEGDCFYPFLECGTYKLEIVDGTHSYFSVPFDAVCDMNDIPDGYRVMLDFNRCVMRDEEGNILYEECSDIPEPEPPEPEITVVKYGYLYNWYAATDAANISAAGWGVPTRAQFEIFALELDPDYLWNLNNAGGLIKETGLLYWDAPNTDATNIRLFNFRGTGYRYYFDGIFDTLKVQSTIWSYTEHPFNPDQALMMMCYYDSERANIPTPVSYMVMEKEQGMPIRLIKNSTILTDGQMGTYTGNDGKIYRTICIGTQEWLADNLCETLYRDLSPIPEVTDDAAWAALATGARCSYNNDESYAL